jgi:hypothetical protein
VLIDALGVRELSLRETNEGASPAARATPEPNVGAVDAVIARSYRGPMRSRSR